MKRLLIAAIGLASLTGCGQQPEISETSQICESEIILHRPTGRTRGGRGHMSGMEKNVFDKTNEARREYGKRSLKMSSHLNIIAFKHSFNMAMQNEMNHRLDGEGVADRATNIGYSWRSIGENIAFGQDSSTQLVNAWMDSPGHRKNILDLNGRGFTNLGVGSYRDRTGKWWHTQVFGRPQDGNCYE